MVNEYDTPLDPGIRRAVEVLQGSGVETYESCEGGPGHAYPEPSIRFHGQRDEGWRALAALQQVGIRVAALRRLWTVLDGEPTGPTWEIVLHDAPEHSGGTMEQWIAATNAERGTGEP